MLTAKQEKFAQAIADGMTQADAYRVAYSTSKMSPAALYVEASNLLKSPKVSLRISELRGNLENKLLWTREMSVKALVQAYKEGGASAKVSAVKELNLMHGYNAPVKVEHAGQGGGPIKIAAIDASRLSTETLSEILKLQDGHDNS